ncbi:dihydrolipoamide acetyltransferase family protein [Fulvivirga sedimenti]|uniref:Dihydrolipoamide acetyltransferase component of pyruvate dehydrogenase complex n=1 Tax=Fulvivirga sedimenti TaxID=2879465 RepID=A0A9X1HP10_9BACT|nr:dihydrolipoamide acetyltransferase family protein [Fulvivirga sedimenti]MCA6075375.1 2-oxo acid dehydrogenase subunit E2 [Fulvivirga sedimenti]MCA6076552.1 2-oxo acid dehydrogenase subunit E2 [Fulvivirga sedimenti]MCA6077680.1 2-oxo acid dehydrogenase subunit E2 [Fulvivirga sedimenti]
MAQVELIMPKMGESIMEATVLTWLKKEGDTIEEDESVLEVATDKVDTEVPSTHGGVLTKILANEGDVVPVGNPIAIITTEKEEKSESKPAPPAEAPAVEKQPVVESKPAAAVVSNGSASNGQDVPSNSNGRFYSPLVKNIAREEGIGKDELERIPGSGKEGRVTKQDILSYLETRGSEVSTLTAPAPAQTSVQSSSPAPKVNISVSGEDEIIEMDRMRKMIAQRMVDSKRISPHVTSFVEADVTEIVFWRNRNKNEFKKREGDNLTFTPIFIDAVVKAIKDYPMINIQVDGDRIIKKRDINIGLAVALPSGNLIVPVIHNADQYNITGLAKKVNDLAKRARNNQLKPDELSGGTFSISNVGSFGNVMGTPIIMQPQVAILALGAITKKPAVVETPHGDAIAIRHKMFLSHSYDHRVVDGSLGGMVVRRVADYLERFDPNTSV